MASNKPNALWRLLLAIAPGALSLLLTAFGKLALSRNDEVTPSIIGVLLIPLLSLGAGIYFASRSSEGSAGKLVGFAILYTAGLTLLNFAIAFAGCAAMQPYFRIQ